MPRTKLLRLGPASAVVAVLVWSSCAQLDDIPVGVCGNSIVEAGEDCDGFAQGSGTACNAAGTAGACRYDCAPKADGSAGHACPSGWGCGLDGLCRAASGTFEAPRLLPGVAVGAVDLDGDRRRDLMLMGGSGLTVEYYDGTRAPQAEYTVPALVGPGQDATGDLDADGRADLAVPGAFTMGILRGQADHTLAPTVEASVPIDAGEGARGVAADVFRIHEGAEALSLERVGTPPKWTLRVQAIWSEATPIVELTDDPSKLPGESLPVGDLDPSTPCDEVVFGYADAHDVLVYSTCTSLDVPAFHATPHVVHVGGGAHIDGQVFVVDADSDGRLDLVADVVRPDGIREVHVAFGVPGHPGSFHSSPPGPNLASPDDTTGVLGVVLDAGIKGGGEPGGGGGAGGAGGGSGQGGAGGTIEFPSMDFGHLLDVGHLDGDGVVDLVYADYLGFSRTTNAQRWFEVRAHLAGPWDQARIADFNINGRPDVIGSTRSRSGLSFLNGAGSGAFNVFTVATPTPIDHLTVGDFDGDLVPDVAFAELAANGTGGDTLAVSFGRADEAPATPVVVGRVGTTRRMVAGVDLVNGIFGYSMGSVPDAVFDLAVLSVDGSADKGVITLISGSGDRQLQSPLILFRQEGEGFVPMAPASAAMGDAGGAAPGADLFVVCIDQSDYQLRVLAFEGRGDGTFEPPAIYPAPVANYVWGAAVTAIVEDLDGPDAADARQEVVVVGSHYDDAYTALQGFVSVYRATADGFGLQEPVTIQAPRPLAFFPVDAGTLPLPSYVVDVDGDGYRDLVVTLGDSTYGQPEPVDSGGPDTGAPAAEPNEVAVFWNDHGTFDPARVARVTLPADYYSQFSSAVAMQLDADGELELVVPAQDASYRLDLDPKTRTFGSPVALPGAPGGIFPIHGDLDGDGLDDLVLAQPGTSSVLFAKAVRP